MIIQALLVALVMFVVKFFDWAFCLNVSRPMVIGALVGIVLGQPVQGTIIGAAVELVFLGVITIGGSVPQETSIGSCLGVAYALLLHKNYQVAITLSVPISILGAFFYNTLKLVFTALVEKLEKYLDNQNDRAYNILWSSQILLFCGVYAAVVFVGIVAGTSSIQTIVNSIPKNVMNGLTVATGILPALGFGMLLKMLWEKSIALFFFIGFGMAAYGNIPTMGIALFAACIAVYVCYTDFNSKKAAVNSNSKVAQLSEEEDFFNE